MYPLLAIILGLSINFLSGGLPFSTVICVFAGIFLIMPSLLKFELKDFLILKDKKQLVLINIIINFLFLPLLFFVSSSILFGETSFLKYAFLFLGLLSGGGMLLSWVGKTSGDSKIAFSLFIVNFVIFSIIFFPLNSLLLEQGEIAKNTTSLFMDFSSKSSAHVNTCVISNLTGGTFSCFSSSGAVSPIASFFILVIFPFFVSRIIRFSRRLSKFLISKIKIISSISTFLLITYIFSLEQVHNILDTDKILISKIAFLLIFLYLISFLVSYSIYYFSRNKETNALFWVSFTRFITLGLVFSFVYSTYFGTEFLIVFVIAYFIQIIFSFIASYLIRE